ncbi:MAG: hypothetical protein HY461_02135 [Parcubacteria group bacterium]|nr:hypothetical protein [Parcubacteria group bacterium]
MTLKRAISCLMLVGLLVLAMPHTASAQSFELFPGEKAAMDSNDFRLYVLNFYNFSIAAGILIATVLIMIGGIIWVTSAGNPGRIETAKSYIIDSIVGVILLFGAVVILRLINPALVNLPKITPTPLGSLGACVYMTKSGDETYKTCQTNSELSCKETLKGKWVKNTSCGNACPEKKDGRPGECESKDSTPKPTTSTSSARQPNDERTSRLICEAQSDTLSFDASRTPEADCSTHCAATILATTCVGAASGTTELAARKLFQCTCTFTGL